MSLRRSLIVTCVFLLALPFAGSALAQDPADRVFESVADSGANGSQSEPPEPGDPGPNVSITLSEEPGPFEGNVSVRAAGGAGGNADATGMGDAADGAIGGAGGHVTLVVDVPVAGGISVDVSAGLGGENSTQTHSAPRGAPGTAEIEVSSSVGTSGAYSIFVSAWGDTVPPEGDILVVLKDGAVLEGRIGQKNGGMVVRFDMTVRDRANFEEASAYLNNPDNWAQGLGSVTINGNTYTWESGISIDSQLKMLAALIRAGGATGIPGRPDYLTCKPGGVVAIDKGEVITFNAKGPNGRFHVGDLVGNVFASANVSGWTVTVEGKGKKQSAKVWNGDGDLVSTCRL